MPRSGSGRIIGSLLGGASLALAARLLFMVASFAVTSITALQYGAGAVGVIATLTTITTMLGVAANAGTTTSVTSYLAGMSAKGQEVAARRTYLRIIGIGLGGSMVAAFVLAAGAPWLSRHLLTGLDGVAPLLLVAVAMVGVLLRVQSELSTFALRALGSVKGFSTLVMLPAVVNLAILGTGIAAGLGPWVTVAGFVGGLAFGAVAGLAWNERLFRRRAAASASAAGPKPETEAAPGLGAILHFSFPMMLSTFGSYVVSGAGVLLMAVFASEADTGHFSVALRLATLTSLVLMSFNAIATPIFARLHTEGDRAALVATARQSARVMFWAVVPLIVGLAVAGPWLLQLAFGPGFEAAYVPMLVILGAQLVNGVTGPSDFLMNMTGLERQLRNIIVPAAALSVVLGVLLIPVWGGIGAALAYGTSMCAWNIAAAIMLRRQFGAWTGYLPNPSCRIRSDALRRRGGAPRTAPLGLCPCKSCFGPLPDEKTRPVKER